MKKNAIKILFSVSILMMSSFILSGETIAFSNKELHPACPNIFDKTIEMKEGDILSVGRTIIALNEGDVKESYPTNTLSYELRGTTLLQVYNPFHDDALSTLYLAEGGIIELPYLLIGVCKVLGSDTIILGVGNLETTRFNHEVLSYAGIYKGVPNILFLGETKKHITQEDFERERTNQINHLVLELMGRNNKEKIETNIIFEPKGQNEKRNSQLYEGFLCRSKSVLARCQENVVNQQPRTDLSQKLIH